MKITKHFSPFSTIHIIYISRPLGIQALGLRSHVGLYLEVTANTGFTVLW